VAAASSCASVHGDQPVAAAQPGQPNQICCWAEMPRGGLGPEFDLALCTRFFIFSFSFKIPEIH
jgi:hypothetical protein